MHIHILGICGTFMAGVARIAKMRGDTVTGCDAKVYPPMSEQLRQAGIELTEGYAAGQLALKPDLFVVGNAVSRGNPLLEAILEADAPYVSGPEWLERNVLAGRHVVCVAGTHGKTTTTSLVAHILEKTGLNPSFLVGGVPSGFGASSRLTDSPYFVIEGDEYDTCFSDKRSKFVHYHPRTFVINNLEFDHADIFENLAAIQKQFHHAIRTMPAGGTILANGPTKAVAEVLAMGTFSRVEFFNGRDWSIDEDRNVARGGVPVGRQVLPLPGRHNASNALAAVAAAASCGVRPQDALEALASFKGVKRRLEVRARVRGVTLYDDFAHHPTAIEETVAALRTVTKGRIIAVFEPRSNTMRMGTLASSLAASLSGADAVIAYRGPNVSWDVAAALAPLGPKAETFEDIRACAEAAVAKASDGDAILVMSNGAFGGIHATIEHMLQES